MYGQLAYLPHLQLEAAAGAAGATSAAVLVSVMKGFASKSACDALSKLGVSFHESKDGHVNSPTASNIATPKGRINAMREIKFMIGYGSTGGRRSLSFARPRQ